MKKWKLLYKNPKSKISHLRQDFDGQANPKSIIRIILNNRGLKTKKEIDEFLKPDLKKITVASVGIDKKHLKKTIKRIKRAIAKEEEVIVFGDYDVDGISGAAILWETLTEAGAKALPYIPHRLDEGYGLSKIGIDNLLLKNPKIKLIITVDNGIVASEAVEHANKKGIDIIITDHHVPSKNLPKAYAIFHTTKLCGAGVAYLLAQEISNFKFQISNKKIQNTKYKILSTHLELVALATIADLVPLTRANRTLVKFGIEELRATKRPGLLALIKEAEIDKSKIDVFEIGHVIDPRLNAMGRLEYAMDSLRLLCTKDLKMAETLAKKLISTNKRRQELTISAFEHARLKIINQSIRPLRIPQDKQAQDKKSQIPNLLFIAHESYQQGVIGLVAGRLVEEFYRPTIVLSIGEKYSKASARSISGFNIIEFIRTASDLLVDAGGHPMAAGFTVETAKLSLVQRKLEQLAEELLDEDKLIRSVRIDCELDLSFIDKKLYDVLQKLAPFGMGNPQPTFITKNITIKDMRLVGADGKHLKLRVSQSNSPEQLDAIGFSMGGFSEKIRIGNTVDLIYTIEQNEWNGNNRLQLKIKDLRKD